MVKERFVKALLGLGRELTPLQQEVYEMLLPKGLDVEGGNQVSNGDIVSRETTRLAGDAYQPLNNARTGFCWEGNLQDVFYNARRNTDAQKEVLSILNEASPEELVSILEERFCGHPINTPTVFLGAIAVANAKLVKRLWSYISISEDPEIIENIIVDALETVGRAMSIDMEFGNTYLKIGNFFLIEVCKLKEPLELGEEMQEFIIMKLQDLIAKGGTAGEKFFSELPPAYQNFILQRFESSFETGKISLEKERGRVLFEFVQRHRNDGAVTQGQEGAVGEHTARIMQERASTEDREVGL